MDQGLSAVLGASVGVVGTLGTGVLTYLATRRQASDQGRIEHSRALRAERREAYLAVVVAGEPVDRALNLIAHRDDVPGGSMEAAPADDCLREAIEELSAGVHELYKSQAGVDLVGPGEVRSSAINIWAAARDLRGFLERVVRREVADDSYQYQCESAVDYYERQRTHFADAARRVMESPPA